MDREFSVWPWFRNPAREGQQSGGAAIASSKVVPPFAKKSCTAGIALRSYVEKRLVVNHHHQQVRNPFRVRGRLVITPREREQNRRGCGE